MKTFWIASYPKSGNTWVRFLLYNYLYGDVEKSDDVANRIPGIHEFSSISGFGTPQETIHLRTERFARFQKMDGPLVCKTHYMFTRHHPLLAQTSGFFYVLRNPRDVLLSNMNYAKIIQVYQGGGDQDRQYAEAFISNLGDYRWLERGMGSWLDNVLSWLSAARAFPHLLIRYEDIKQDPHSVLAKMVSLMGLKVDDEAVNRAVERSSFEQMQRLETRERSAGSGSKTFAISNHRKEAGFMFMNRGKSGQSLDQFGPDLEQKYEERFGELCRMFGY